jgi:hypothetical protein
MSEKNENMVMGDGGSVLCSMRCVAVSSAAKSTGSLATGAGGDAVPKHSIKFRGLASPALAELLDTPAGKAPAITLAFADKVLRFDCERVALQFEASVTLSIVEDAGKTASLIASAKVNDCDCPFADLAELMLSEGNLYMMPMSAVNPDLFTGEVAPIVTIHCAGEKIVTTQARGEELDEAVRQVVAAAKVAKPQPAPLLDDAPAEVETVEAGKVIRRCGKDIAGDQGVDDAGPLDPWLAEMNEADAEHCPAEVN